MLPTKTQIRRITMNELSIMDDLSLELLDFALSVGAIL